MDFYMILSIVIFVAVVAVLILAVRLYQLYRRSAGWHTGKFFKIGQFMGALIGKYHLNEIGYAELSRAAQADPDEEQYLFSELDKE